MNISGYEIQQKLLKEPVIVQLVHKTVSAGGFNQNLLLKCPECQLELYQLSSLAVHIAKRHFSSIPSQVEVYSKAFESFTANFGQF